jgi:Pentapeptide repeats (8 copies)
MTPSVESALISAAAVSVGALAIAAAASAGLRISRSISQRLASHHGGHVTRAPRPARLPMALGTQGGRLLRSGRWQRRRDGSAGQGRATDRYAKAARQFGSDQLDVRTRGIYALGRSARDPSPHHPAVADVLAAFVRKHSREQWPVPKSTGAPAPERTIRPDVQAALTVIGRWDTTDRRGRIDFTLANLTRANLISADLADAKLTGVILTAAELISADLTAADLISADLSHADLTGAKLTRAKLTGADLTAARLGAVHLSAADLRRADLTAADLTRANLTDANLTQANLTDANLTQANLTDANLTQAILTRANLVGAQWPQGSAAPGGWLRHPGSGLLARASAAGGDSGHL